MNVPVDADLHRRVKSDMALEDQKLYEFVEAALRAHCERVEAKHGISRTDVGEPADSGQEPR